MNLRLSPSAIATWRECPAKFWRQYLAVEKWPDNPVYFAQGHVVHKMAEIAINGQTRARNAGNTPKDPTHWISAGFDREWNREARRVTDWKGLKPEKAREQALGASHALVSVVGDWEVEGTEQKVVVPVTDEIVVPTVIDIRQVQRIVDIKTYSDSEPPYENPRLNSEQTQPLAYALGAWHLTGIVPKVFQWAQVSMKPPHLVTVSPEMPLTESHAFAYLAMVYIVARAMRRSTFQPRQAGGCKSCPYKSRGFCPGTLAAA